MQLVRSEVTLTLLQHALCLQDARVLRSLTSHHFEAIVILVDYKSFN